MTAGDGIVITASHVRLRLGDHRLRGPGNKSGRAIVIDGASDVMVRGGVIERFGFGAVLNNAEGCRVRGLSILGGDESADPANGNPPQIGFMLVNSAMNLLAGNQLQGVNLGIFVRGGASYRNLILDNRVRGGANGLLAICYNPAPGAGTAGPREDLVEGNLLSRYGTGVIASVGSESNRFVRNTIHYFDAPYADRNGTNRFVSNVTMQVAR